MRTLKVYAQIVSFNSFSTLEACLRSLFAQTDYRLGVDLRIAVYENGESEESRAIVSSLQQELVEGALFFHKNETNTGFAEGNNIGFADALRWGAEAVLLVNPDLALSTDAVREMQKALVLDSRCGAVCPKLLRADESLRPLQPPVLDAAGMYITPEIRHLDRGSGQLDIGQYQNEEYVFGGSGACLLLRSECLKDIAFPHLSCDPMPLSIRTSIPVFDKEFFAYREDADLAWRMQWLGWKTRYQPTAVGFHVRSVLPENRSTLAPEINSWSVRNRFLLQIHNLTLLTLGPKIVFSIWRNLLVVGAVFFRERSSLCGLKQAIGLVPRGLRRRSELMRRRRVHSLAISRWFSEEPVSEPALSLEPKKMNITSVRAVIISYCTKDLTLELCRRLRDLRSNLSYELVIQIVENSPYLHPEALESVEWSDVFLKRSPENLGFAGAVNFALDEMKEDALLILNPDISLDIDCFNRLVSALENYPQLSVVSPVLCHENGKPQYGFTIKRLPRFAAVIAELLLLHRLFPENPWSSELKMVDEIFAPAFLDQIPLPETSPQENIDRPLLVEQPAGACLLVRSKDARAIGGFDRRFYPAWFEDVDFCKRLQIAGKSIAVIGHARATHLGGVTKDKLPSERFLQFWFGNMIRYWKKHGSFAQYLTIRLLVPLILLFRAELFFLLGVFATLRRNSLAARRLHSYSKDLLRVSYACLRQ